MPRGTAARTPASSRRGVRLSAEGGARLERFERSAAASNRAAVAPPPQLGRRWRRSFGRAAVAPQLWIVQTGTVARGATLEAAETDSARWAFPPCAPRR